MIRRLFIANRGEIALRVARTARRMGLEVSSAFSTVDAGLPHLRLCHRAVELRGDPARVYLDIGNMLDAAKRLGADAVHPGYGFLSENEDFAAAVEAAGMAFVGPTPEQIAGLGDKIQARMAAERAGVPTVPGHSEAVGDADTGRALAARLGYPVLVKASGGGGGRGMRVVHDAAHLEEALARASSEAQAAFGDPRVFIEKYIPRARHVEIQILGDGRGGAVALGERECSVQRRHQKLIEESPAPALTHETAALMGAKAAALAESVKYRGAGTMEFLVPFGSQDFYFIEMNTRLQVEHPVTELRTGLDLVAEQIHIASGLGFSSRVRAWTGPSAPPLLGHAIEARVIAEDPDANFRPECGRMDLVALPAGPGIRVDAWAESGLEVSPFYDSLLAKVLAWGQTRQEALERLDLALAETLIHPLRTTAPYLARLIASDAFRSGDYATDLVTSLQASGDSPVPPVPAEAAVLAAAELLTGKERSGLLPKVEHGRALTSWQQAT